MRRRLSGIRQCIAGPFFLLILSPALKQPLFVFVTQRAHSLGNRNRGEIALTDSETSLFWLI